MPSPIIARADVLMHRKRKSGSEFDDIPVLTDSVDEFDDIPVLTDAESVLEAIAAPRFDEAVIMPDELAPLDTPEEAPAEAPALDPALRDQLVFELSSRIEQRLMAELPRLINSAIEDYLAEQEAIAQR